MSIAAAFSNGKQMLRRDAFALATVTAMAGANDVQAAEFSREECSLIAVTAGRVVQALGPDTLSLEFRQSLASFMVPVRGAGLTCTGPAQIAVPTVNDVAAYNTIRGFLPFDIHTRGVRPVAQSSPAPDPATPALR